MYRNFAPPDRVSYCRPSGYASPLRAFKSPHSRFWSPTARTTQPCISPHAILFLLSQYIARIPSPACTNHLRLTLAVLHSTPSNIFLPVGSYNFTGQRKLFTHLYNSHVRLAHHSCSNPVSHLRTINLYRCMAFQIPAPLTAYPIVPIYAPLAALWLHTPLTVGHLEAWHQRDRGP